MTELQNDIGNNAIETKSASFADRIIKLYKYLREQKREFAMSKQLLRSGTSIGANIAEGLFAVSKKDFLLKLKIAEKEMSESIYWLARLKHNNFLTDRESLSINTDAYELQRILSAIIRKFINNNFVIICAAGQKYKK